MPNADLVVDPTRINLGIVSVRAESARAVLGTMANASPGTVTQMASFCEASLFSSALTDQRIVEVLRCSNWVFADGVAVKSIAQVNGTPFPERMPGPAFMLMACEYGLRFGWRHYFYGGAAGVADQLAKSLKERFEGLVVAGTRSPPFRDLTQDEEDMLRDEINRIRPHIMWVALGSPRQELWVYHHLDTLGVPYMFPVGAAFDFHSGSRPWAPQWVRRIGLEWLFRMTTGGRRIFLRNCRCVSTVGLFLVKEYVRHLYRRGCRR